MTAPTIVNNFFKLGQKQMQKIGSKTLSKMGAAVKDLSNEVLEVVAQPANDASYSIKDQFIKLRTTGRKGGEFFKVQTPVKSEVPARVNLQGAEAAAGDVAATAKAETLLNARTATRGKQDAEKFAKEKLDLIARFQTALRDETSEHVSVKLATEGGGLRRRKITNQSVDRYKDAVAAFKADKNQGLLGELKNDANPVETRILKQGRFQIRQIIPAVPDEEEKLTAPAKKFTVKLAQGKQETTEYVNNGLQVAKQIQERPDTIGKKFLLNNTTSQTFRGRVPSEAKIQEYEQVKNSFVRHERSIEGIIKDSPEGNYSRRLTGKNQYVVQKTAEGPKERYTLTPHKESLSQFVEKANKFAEDVAFQRPEVSPRLMVKQGHLDSAGIKKYETAQTIFKDVPRFDAETDTLKMRLKGNGKFSIKDVRPQPEAAEGTAVHASEKATEPLRSIKLRQGNQDFGNFVENGIRFANLKKQYNQFMSESFGVKGNWLTGNRVKAKGLARREEAIQFFGVDANQAELQKLQDAGLSFKLRKHGKIALQYGQGNGAVKSLSQRNGEGLTGFLTRGVKEAHAFVTEQQQKAAKKALRETHPSSSVSGGKQRFHAQLQKELKKPESQRLPAGFSIVAQDGNLQILQNGRNLETLKPEAFGGQAPSDFVKEAIDAAHLFDGAIPASSKPGFFSTLKNSGSVKSEAPESMGRPGLWKRLLGKGKTETAKPFSPTGPIFKKTPAVDRGNDEHQLVLDDPLALLVGNRQSMNVSPNGTLSLPSGPIGVAFSNKNERITLEQMLLGIRDGEVFRDVARCQPTLVSTDIWRRPRSVTAKIEGLIPEVPLRPTEESRRKFRMQQQLQWGGGF